MRGSASVALDMRFYWLSVAVKGNHQQGRAATVSAVRISTFPNDSFFQLEPFSTMPWKLAHTILPDADSARAAVPIESEPRLHLFV